MTIMLVDETEDTGEILRQRATPIDGTEHAGQLSDRLAEMGAELLLETIPDWIAGGIGPEPQDSERATRARRVTKRQGRIDWSQPADQIARHVRAYTPWPAATTTLGDSTIRVTAATGTEESVNAEPGTITEIGNVIAVAAGSGTLQIHRLQRAGKRELSAEEFARGVRDLAGLRFGSEDD